MSIDAYSKAVFRSPDRWHSMTVEVRMGTTWAGNLEMLRETRISMRAADLAGGEGLGFRIFVKLRSCLAH
jgi:hypothetical protein